MSFPSSPSVAPRDFLRVSTPAAQDVPVAYVIDAPERERVRHRFVLLHGLPGSSRDFRWLVPALAARGALSIRVELPGFGETPRAVEPTGGVVARGRFVVSLVRALVRAGVLDDDADLRPWIVGHSMGGVVAAAACAEASTAFAGLVLLSSPGLRLHRELRRARPRLVDAALAAPGADRWLLPGVRRLLERAGFRGVSDAETRHVFRCLARTDIRAHAARLRALRLPIAHAYGEDDPLIEASILAETSRVVGGPTIRFRDGGHNPQKAHANELADAMVRWADERAR